MGRGSAWIGVTVLLVLNVLLQAFMHREGLDNEVLNARNPTAHDGIEYARAAETIANGGRFVEAFGNGWRMPGYSLFLAPFYRTAGEPIRAARRAQILLTASLAALFFGITARLTGSRRTALAAAALVAAWFPLYHFSSMLYAESVSIFLMAVLLFLLAGWGGARGSRGSFRRTAALGLLGLTTAALVYLKPNHLLLLVPVAGFLIAAEGRAPPGTAIRRGLPGAIARGLKSAGIVAVITLALLAPWSVFLSGVAGGFTPLTATSGYNLYLGTGKAPLPGEEGSLPHRVALATGLRGGPGDLPESEPPGTAGESGRMGAARAYAAWSAGYGERARAIRAEQSAAVALYGASKVLHAFGFSFRDARDFLLALFTLAVLAASVMLWRTPGGGDRKWVLFLALTTLAVAAQAFSYLPNQRFKTVMFDPPALVILILAASRSWDRWRDRGRDRTIRADNAQPE